MDNDFQTILQTYHDATDLNLYVFNKQLDFVSKFTSPLAPNLPLEIIYSFKNANKNDLHLKLINNQSSVGFFLHNDLLIFGWNSNFTLASGTQYDRLAPLLGWNKFTQNMKCLFFMFYQRWPKTSNEKQKLDIGENIFTTQPTSASYKGYIAECELMAAVSAGNIALFNKRFRDFVKYGNLGSFKQSKLRNEKDLAISATTLYTRAAIKGGVSISEAYQLSDKIINQIEKDTIISNYYEYTRAIGEIFLNRVKRFKRQNVTSLVFQAQEFIYNNCSAIKSVNEVAQHLNISLSYLQHLFKKETGISLLTFINQNKIRLAKHELVFSKNSIEEIAYKTGFSSLSAFSSTFKRITHLSPLEYRKNKFN